MSIVQYFRVVSPDGLRVKTGQKFCRHDLLIKPKLYELSVNKNGTYQVPAGYAGHGQVNVNVSGKRESELAVLQNGSYEAPEGTVYAKVNVAVPIKEETTLVITKNGTYNAPNGKVFTSIVVNVPNQVDDEVVPDTNTYAIKVGGTFSIAYDGSSPDVECPTFLSYYVDGGIVVFTGIAIGNGVIYFRRGGDLIGQYTVIVTEATHVHQYTTTVVPPTCTAGGYTIKTCACGDSITGSLTAKKGHAWGAPYYSDEFSSGYGRKCTVCFALEELDEPECDHYWEFTKTVAPTCNEMGYDLYTCSVCTATDRDNEVEKLGHDLGNVYASDEFSSGYGRACQREGCDYTEEASKDDCTHPEESVTEVGSTAVTCTTDGSVSYLCTVCEKEWTEPIKHPGHSWTYPYYSSVFSSGYGRKCTVCFALEELDKPECDHSYEFTRRVNATCTEGGYDLYTCSLCGAITYENKVSKLGHSLGDWSKSDDADTYVRWCTREGCEHHEEKMPTGTLLYAIDDTFTLDIDGAEISIDYPDFIELDNENGYEFTCVDHGEGIICIYDEGELIEFYKITVTN